VAWNLALGDEQSRTDIQGRYGGSSSRGISAPASGSGNTDIMLWWKPEHGHAFGYVDGWTDDASSFYFTGTGQFGDQRFESPHAENGRVRDHVVNSDRVRLLRYVRKNWVRYTAELTLHPTEPWRWMDGPDGTGQIRRMIQFRFMAVDAESLTPDEVTRSPVLDRPRADPLPTSLPAPSKAVLEAMRTKQFKRLVLAREVVATRAEAQLVRDFSTWLQSAHGLSSSGLTIPYDPEGRNLRADLYIHSLEILVEAKSSSAREHLRTAIGQLLDYARYVSPRPRLMCLVPDRPADDMLMLFAELGVTVAWRWTDGSFKLSDLSAIT
jgi:hypothetical protein